MVYLVFDTLLFLLWHFYAIGQIFIAVNGQLKVRERGNRKENCKITKMLLDVVTFSWKIISNKFERRSVANVDKVI